MSFLTITRDEIKDMANEIREGFIESRIIRAVILVHTAGFSLWVVGFVLAIPFGFALTALPFITFMVGSGLIFIGFILMFISLGIDEVNFNKIMKRSAARNANR